MHATVRPCPSCDRFVRYGDERCPFCSHALEREDPPTIHEFSRLSRAALAAAGAAMVAGCAAPQVPPYGRAPYEESQRVTPLDGGQPVDEEAPVDDEEEAPVAPEDQTVPEPSPGSVDGEPAPE